jgi:adenylate cyclase
VRDQVRDKLAFSFEDMGELQVKNIARPVRVHRILLDQRAQFSGASYRDIDETAARIT